MDRDDLEAALLEAHAKDDKTALVELYTLAADLSEAHQEVNAACFYLTHAFVFALETGAPEAAVLNQRLAERGRAKLLEF